MDQIRVELQVHLDAFDPISIAPEGLRHAAVAITIVSAGDEPGIVMTRRTSRLRDHPGQFAFPGGRLDPGESVMQAARRELLEEVGLKVDEAALMGVLDDYATRSGYLMTPVVLWSGDSGRHDLVANEGEVEEAFVVPFSELGQEPNVYTIPESEHPIINVPFRDTVLHAPSGAIMHQFAEIALHRRVTRVASYDQPLFAWGSRQE